MDVQTPKDAIHGILWALIHGNIIFETINQSDMCSMFWALKKPETNMDLMATKHWGSRNPAESNVLLQGEAPGVFVGSMDPLEGLIFIGGSDLGHDDVKNIQILNSSAHHVFGCISFLNYTFNPPAAPVLSEPVLCISLINLNIVQPRVAGYFSARTKRVTTTSGP